MQVTLSVGGKFHAFDLASQLAKRNHLQSLITSYPKFALRDYGIPPQRVRSLLLKELFQRMWGTLPYLLRKRMNPFFFLHELFDREAVRYITPTDLFVGFSSFTLHSIEVILARNNKNDALKEFLKSISKQGINRIDSSIKDELKAVDLMRKHSLDFDDSLQLSLCLRNNLTIEDFE